EHDGLFVVDEEGRVEEFLAEAKDLFRGGAGVGFRLMIEGGQSRCFHCSCKREWYSTAQGMRQLKSIWVVGTCLGVQRKRPVRSSSTHLSPFRDQCHIDNL